MDTILANCSASISEFKKNPSALIEKSNGEPIVILNHNKPTAYLIPAATWENLMEKMDDYNLSLIIEERENEKDQAIEVSLDEL